tara:strand:+ start:346 stop:642 length:297 start_codon:yes stop_codon:yes gene_type:complete
MLLFSEGKMPNIITALLKNILQLAWRGDHAAISSRIRRISKDWQWLPKCSGLKRPAILLSVACRPYPEVSVLSEEDIQRIKGANNAEGFYWLVVQSSD